MMIGAATPTVVPLGIWNEARMVLSGRPTQTDFVLDNTPIGKRQDKPIDPNLIEAERVGPGRYEARPGGGPRSMKTR